MKQGEELQSWIRGGVEFQAPLPELDALREWFLAWTFIGKLYVKKVVLSGGCVFAYVDCPELAQAEESMGFRDLEYADLEEEIFDSIEMRLEKRPMPLRLDFVAGQPFPVFYAPAHRLVLTALTQSAKVSEADEQNFGLFADFTGFIAVFDPDYVLSLFTAQSLKRPFSNLIHTLEPTDASAAPDTFYERFAWALVVAAAYLRDFYGYDSTLIRKLLTIGERAPEVNQKAAPMLQSFYHETYIQQPLTFPQDLGKIAQIMVQHRRPIATHLESLLFPAEPTEEQLRDRRNFFDILKRDQIPDRGL